jgi:pseudouridine synthase
LKIRLQKILSQAGFSSRRAAERLIRQGRVSVDGEVVGQMGFKADPAAQTITIDGESLPENKEKIYLIIYKPVGVVTTLSDPEGRPTVVSLAPPGTPRVFPIGRLDYDSEGFLILTNDGELANALMHPSGEVPKSYEVKVDGEVTTRQLDQLRKGVWLEDGFTGEAQVRFLRRTKKNSWLFIRLTSGKNRIIRRMCRAVGLDVLRLIRTALGDFELQVGERYPGFTRLLKVKEVKKLWALAKYGEITGKPGEVRRLPGSSKPKPPPHVKVQKLSKERQEKRIREGKTDVKKRTNASKHPAPKRR